MIITIIIIIIIIITITITIILIIILIIIIKCNLSQQNVNDAMNEKKNAFWPAKSGYVYSKSMQTANYVLL